MKATLLRQTKEKDVIPASQMRTRNYLRQGVFAIGALAGYGIPQLNHLKNPWTNYSIHYKNPQRS